MINSTKSYKLKVDFLVFHFPSIFTGFLWIIALIGNGVAIPKYKIQAVLVLLLFWLPVGFLIQWGANRLSWKGSNLLFASKVISIAIAWVALLVVMYFFANMAIWTTTGFGDGPLTLGTDAYHAFTKGSLQVLPIISAACVVLSFIGSYIIRLKQSVHQAHA
jgi:hypothetical protein